jgi:hypothetical protein
MKAKNPRPKISITHKLLPNEIVVSALEKNSGKSISNDPEVRK